MTAPTLDVVGIGNAIVDIIDNTDEAFLARHGMVKGAMTLIDEAQAEAIYAAMGPAIELSGGSAGNTIAGLASLGARCGYIGKVRDDQLGRVFRHDITAAGVRFPTPAAADGPATAVAAMNKALCRRGLESRFVTLMFGIVSSDGQLTYCNAGHNPPIVIGERGMRHLEAGGPVVGLLEFAPYGQETIRLESGDTIIVFSDGVSEALSTTGEEFGDARLQAIAEATGQATAQTIVDRSAVRRVGTTIADGAAAGAAAFA